MSSSLVVNRASSQPFCGKTDNDVTRNQNSERFASKCDILVLLYGTRNHCLRRKKSFCKVLVILNTHFDCFLRN